MKRARRKRWVNQLLLLCVLLVNFCFQSGGQTLAGLVVQHEPVDVAMLSELFEKADVVFLGTIREVSTWDASDDTALFEVEELYKGDPCDNALVTLTSKYGILPMLGVGDRLIVYASRVPSKHENQQNPRFLAISQIPTLFVESRADVLAYSRYRTDKK